MFIRPSLQAELPELIRLINSAYRGEESKAGWTTEATFLEGDMRIDQKQLEEQLREPGAVMLACLDDSGTILGCVYLKPSHRKLYLGMLSVSPKKQGAGIGKLLLSAAEEFGKDMDCQSIYMNVINLRTELIEWYQRKGYQVTAETKPFPSDPVFGRPTRELEFWVLKKNI